MAIVTFWFQTDSAEGVDLNKVITSVTTDNLDSTFNHRLGRRVQGNMGSEWLFVQASATVTAGNLVAIDANMQARNATITLGASRMYSWGVANFQPNQNGVTVSIGNAAGGVCNAGDYFWACLRANGGLGVNAISNPAQGAPRVYIGSSGLISSSATNDYFPGLNVIGASVTGTAISAIETAFSGYLTIASLTA